MPSSTTTNATAARTVAAAAALALAAALLLFAVAATSGAASSSTTTTAAAAATSPSSSAAAPQQQSGDGGADVFKFRYEKSGGIAGLHRVVTYDSASGKITLADDSITGKKEERTLSAAEEARLKDLVVDKARFFELPETFEARAGPADYFSYSLAVTLGVGAGNSHTVAWVDPFAAKGEIPAGLTDLAAEIEKLASAPQEAKPPHPSLGKRRIAETFVIPSAPHDAEGHSLHQAAYLLYPQAGYIYSGTLTVSSTLPADVLVYHDVTGASANDTTRLLTVHKVAGRQYAATTLMKNVTSATFSFAGSAVLVHRAGGSSDPFVAVATIDALRKVSTASISTTPPQPVTQIQSFTVEVAGDSKERFVVQATDSETIRQLVDNYEGRNSSYHVTGRLVKGDGGFNPPWSWHLDPDSVRMAQVSIEVCDGRPSHVEQDLGYWLGTVKTYCPWSSKVVGIINNSNSSSSSNSSSTP
jgi:hypothetical protein